MEGEEGNEADPEAEGPSMQTCAGEGRPLKTILDDIAVGFSCLCWPL